MEVTEEQRAILVHSNRPSTAAATTVGATRSRRAVSVLLPVRMTLVALAFCVPSGYPRSGEAFGQGSSKHGSRGYATRAYPRPHPYEVPTSAYDTSRPSRPPPNMRAYDSRCVLRTSMRISVVSCNDMS